MRTKCQHGGIRKEAVVAQGLAWGLGLTWARKAGRPEMTGLTRRSRRRSEMLPSSATPMARQSAILAGYSLPCTGPPGPPKKRGKTQEAKMGVVEFQGALGHSRAVPAPPPRACAAPVEVAAGDDEATTGLVEGVGGPLVRLVARAGLVQRAAPGAVPQTAGARGRVGVRQGERVALLLPVSEDHGVVRGAAGRVLGEREGGGGSTWRGTKKSKRPTKKRGGG